MKILKHKSRISTIALALVLTMAVAFIACMPAAYARNINTYAFCNVAPNPAGVGQTVLIQMWLNQPPPTASGAQGERWQGFEITVEDPDGATDTLGPYSSDPVGMWFVTFIPDQVGTWTFQMSFPGQTSETGDYYRPSTSNIVELTVQQQKVEEWPYYGYPDNDYWTRPIYGENRDWWPKTGNFLMPGYDSTYRFFDQGSAFAPYNDAPESPHIMWTKPIADGGLIGGQFGSTAYYQGMSYEMKLTPPIILNGKYYYNLYPSSFDPFVEIGFACIDLRTGEELWRNMNDRISVGQILDFESPNQHGGIPYLWSIGSTYKMYDTLNGDFILEINNVTAGSLTLSPYGDLISYVMTPTWFAKWNSTKCIGTAGTTGSEAWQWRPRMAAAAGPIDWYRGIEWNVTHPFHGFFGFGTGLIGGTMHPDVLLAAELGNGWFMNYGYNAKTGVELWAQNRTMQDNPQFIWNFLDYSVLGDKDADIYAFHARDQMRSYGFNMNTGAQIWVTDPFTDAWGMFPSGQITAYGRYYVTAYDGKVHCYNLTNGDTLWEYFGGSSGVETPYGHWPFYSGLLIAEGKVFACNGEHSPSTPLWRGEMLHAIDAYTGKGLWNISGWFFSHGNVVADGYLVGLNGYDLQLYCFGRGPSATTVTASPSVIANGSSVLIQGTITDQSVGQKGTPCVSKASMKAWMEFLHMQKPCPTTVTGVPVTLLAMRHSDREIIEIGTVTSDTSGFVYEWTPPDDDLYTITASFAGDESYGSSWSYTGLSVGPTPEEPEPEPEPVVIPDYTAVFAGIIAAVVVVGGLVVFDIMSVRKLKR